MAERSQSSRAALTLEGTYDRGVSAQAGVYNRAVMTQAGVYNRAAAADAAVISNAVKGVPDETPSDIEPVTITPTPMNQQEIQNRKTYVMEKYALGVILASGITIGMLIVLFLYWNRKAGGDRF